MLFHGHRLGLVRLAAVLSGIALLASSVAHAATVTVINNDGPGEGFNDPTPVAPIGGNPGTTLGAQRLIAFQTAADIWGARLSSAVTIRVRAQFDPLACNATSAILGQAGPIHVARDFSGAGVGATWYAMAEANALHGSDLDPAFDDIDATFNSAIGTTCPFPNVWYYGLDGNPPGSQIDFVSVLVHELGHGVGFLTFVDLATGAKLSGFNDTFMRFLENHGAVPPDYPSMTNAQRVAASIATGNLHWVGPNVRAASSILTAGRVGDHVRMFAPNPQQSGSSVSHWDTVLAPNQVMEPSYTGPLHNPVLELPLFQDIGWTLLTPPPPPPPPPPTAGTCTLASQLGDFNGDRRDDILFFRASDGYLAEYLMNGVQIVAANVVGSIGSGYTVAAVADFNGDGLADILFRRNSDGLLALFLMNGAQVIGAQVVGAVGTEFDVVGAADFNGDGRADILFRRNTDGMFSLFLMNGAQIVAGQILGALGTEWRVRGVRDFNGDGRADILFRRNTDGMLALYEYSGFQLLAAQLLGAVGTDFDVAGVRDFNGDGRADILFRRASDGMVAIFLMNGFQVLATQLIGAVGTDIRVQGVGDFNADGRADMLFRRVSDGLMAIYLMNGFQVVTAQNIGAVGTELTICYGQPPLSPAQVSQR